MHVYACPHLSHSHYAVQKQNFIVKSTRRVNNYKQSVILEYNVVTWQGTYVEGIKEEVVLSPAHALSLIASGEGT